MQALASAFCSPKLRQSRFEYLDSSVQQALIEEFKRQDVLDIVDKMSPDDRARLFDELPAKLSAGCLSNSAQLNAATAQLLVMKRVRLDES